MIDIRNLVERLRKNDAKAQFATSQTPPYSIQGEAADEIDRLRAEVIRLEGELDTMRNAYESMYDATVELANK